MNEFIHIIVKERDIVRDAKMLLDDHALARWVSGCACALDLTKSTLAMRSIIALSISAMHLVEIWMTEGASFRCTIPF